MRFIVWGPANLIRFGVPLVAGLVKDRCPPLAHFPSWWPTGGRGVRVYVLVLFRLVILVFILMTILCGIPDRLSSDCFWARPWWRDVGVGGSGGCQRLFVSFFLLVVETHAKLWCICFGRFLNVSFTVIVLGWYPVLKALRSLYNSLILLILL
jgi:hypothetical protein